jgi:FtsP/CotA-like multicopper oxidase with cupredoxin domain
VDRRAFVRWSGLTAGAALLARVSEVTAQQGAHAVPATRGARSPAAGPSGQPAVVTPNGSTLPLRVVDGVKVGHLVAEPIDHEFAPGLRAHCWGYNGSTPGPTIEAVEGDHLRLYVENRLPEATTVHWHGVIVPNGMDGVAGLTQPAIPPGETYAYDFTVREPGTFMYHPHFDEMTQMALGMVGMFIVHPKRPRGPRVDRDFVLMTHEWKLEVGTSRPDPLAMNDFNLLTFNSKAFPGTQPLLVGLGERVRIRLGNLSPMDHHPIHLHGAHFVTTATDGGYVPASAQLPETTVLVPTGSTRVIELVPSEPGDWPMHCHMTHHIMTQMGHGLPNLVGVDTSALDKRMRGVLRGYMSMGQKGMGGMGDMSMRIPPNSLPMRGGPGPFGTIDMGGMFTLLKVRQNPETADPSGFYEHPKGSVAGPADPERMRADGVEPAKKPG